jgi:acyl-CoA thioesterase FadM
MEYAITRQGGVAALGKTVMVVFNYEKGTPQPIPPEWRQTITAYEPGLES